LKLSIAIAGKGGIGKTTLSALFVRALKERGVGPVLAVDADPNSNLADALGVEEGRHLAEIREQGSSDEGSPASGVGRVRALDDEFQRSIVEAEGFDLITMGRGEGPRCYCYVNNLLRQSLSALARNYESLVLDNEAGMEHLSRRTTNDVDVLIAVLNPTLPSLRAVKRILELSRTLPVTIHRRAVLLNRVGPQGAVEQVASELESLDAERLADVPENEDIERAGAVGQSVFSLDGQNPAVVAVSNIVEGLGAATV
jgi:CO dehydrogenase maturation factor